MPDKYNYVKGTYEEDRQYADGYLGEIKRVLSQVAPIFLNFSIADTGKDTKESTDYILTLTTNSSDVACRLRRPTKYRDWTVRWHRDSGSETEESKLRKGFCRWYLYGWIEGTPPTKANPNRNRVGTAIEDWILLDLNLVRTEGALDRGIIRDNYDGTKYRAIRYTELMDCIVAGIINGKALKPALEISFE